MKQEISVDLSGGKRLSFETGKLAKQAHGSVVVRMGDNVVLATATANPDPREGIDFFPLTVDYREYTYAGGRIPGGFIKREGRPSEREILTSRQIDRPLLPLFPEGFHNENQVISLVLSVDTNNDTDVLAHNCVSFDTWWFPKDECHAKVSALKTVLINSFPEEDESGREKLSGYFEILRDLIFRDQVKHQRRRPDVRQFDDVRPINIETGVLPRT